MKSIKSRSMKPDVVVPLKVISYYDSIMFDGECYGSRGCSVTVKYNIGKFFLYKSGFPWDKQIVQNNAINWVCNMERAGYKLLGAPKYDFNSNGVGVSVDILCEYRHDFRHACIDVARKRAWRFYEKTKQKIDMASNKNKRFIYSQHNENTK